MFNIENRRYVGNKFKLINWIKENITEQCPNCNSFFDVFAGTGSVSNYLLNNYDEFTLNDFLYSNEIIYKAFFYNNNFNKDLLLHIKDIYNKLDISQIKENYISEKYGNKFFSKNDALQIGHIREDIHVKKVNREINEKEYNILLASLLYSADKAANTCGHYDAYIKGKEIKDKFFFDLIKPLDTTKKSINIYRCDANKLAREIKSDIAFVDPPYNSRQYSRFYHVLETITKWDKPELYGTALKPKEENMSEYCKVNAPIFFSDLISSLNAKYIVVTYNNTYNSKSSSSRNKITLEEIKDILTTRGNTKIFEQTYRYFNAGKTILPNHKEYLFITKVEKNAR